MLQPTHMVQHLNNLFGFFNNYIDTSVIRETVWILFHQEIKEKYEETRVDKKILKDTIKLS